MILLFGYNITCITFLFYFMNNLYCSFITASAAFLVANATLLSQITSGGRSMHPSDFGTLCFFRTLCLVLLLT